MISESVGEVLFLMWGLLWLQVYHSFSIGHITERGLNRRNCRRPISDLADQLDGIIPEGTVDEGPHDLP